MHSMRIYYACKRCVVLLVKGTCLFFTILFALVNFGTFNGTPVDISNLPVHQIPEIINCHRLLDGDAREQERAADYMKKSKFFRVPDHHYVQFASNCTHFKTGMGYKLKALSQQEEEFPIAFSILMHKEVHRTERLLRAIYRPQNLYCIHVDQKADDNVKAGVSAIAKCFPNVFLTKSETIIYGGYSRLQADLNCMADMLKHEINWKYYINQPNEAYPLRTVEEIVEILQLFNGSNNIEGLPEKSIQQERTAYKWRPSSKFFSNEQKMTNTMIEKEPPPHGLKIVKGLAYGIFSRNFVDFIIHNQIAHDLLEWSRDTYSPDEHVWATLHHIHVNPQLQTPGGYTGPPGYHPCLSTYASWKGTHPCHSHYRVRDVCIFGVADLPDLIQKKEFFANKFHSNFEPLALDCLEKWHRETTLSHAKTDMQFYANLPFVRKNKLL